MDRQAAILALENGQVFHGEAFGFITETEGECVFNTAMTGYQEILTDPSYAGQMVTFTSPHIGNVGVNEEDNQSKRVWLKALIVRELSLVSSNWRSEQTLEHFLKEQKVMGIQGIDTRALTHILREQGAQKSCITIQVTDPERAVQRARDFNLSACDLVKHVSTAESYIWDEPTPWPSNTGNHSLLSKTKPHIVVYDFGVKYEILRLLVDRGCRVTVVPAKTTASDVMKLNPQGVFLSNGPGDPATCDYAIEAINVLLKEKIPLLGICLGFQLLALALGAKTYKMKFGHHGSNHPVGDYQTNRVLISSQNHGFAVVEDSLPDTVMVTHRSLFDNTIQGIRCRDLPVFAFQGHPEAGPGPNDIHQVFDQFVLSMIP